MNKAYVAIQHRPTDQFRYFDIGLSSFDITVSEGDTFRVHHARRSAICVIRDEKHLNIEGDSQFSRSDFLRGRGHLAVADLLPWVDRYRRVRYRVNSTDNYIEALIELLAPACLSIIMIPSLTLLESMVFLLRRKTEPGHAEIKGCLAVMVSRSVPLLSSYEFCWIRRQATHKGGRGRVYTTRLMCLCRKKLQKTSRRREIITAADARLDLHNPSVMFLARKSDNLIDFIKE